MDVSGTRDKRDYGSLVEYRKQVFRGSLGLDIPAAASVLVNAPLGAPGPSDHVVCPSASVPRNWAVIASSGSAKGTRSDTTAPETPISLWVTSLQRNSEGNSQ